MNLTTITPEIAKSAIDLVRQRAPQYLHHPNTNGHLRYLLKSRNGPEPDETVVIDLNGLCHGGVAVLLWVLSRDTAVTCRVAATEIPGFIHGRFPEPQKVNRNTRTLRLQIERWFMHQPRPTCISTMGLVIKHICLWGEDLTQQRLSVKTPTCLNSSSPEIRYYLGKLDDEIRLGDRIRIERIRASARLAEMIAEDATQRLGRLLGPANYAWLFYAASDAYDWLAAGSRGHTAVPGSNPALPTYHLMEALDAIEAKLEAAPRQWRVQYRSSRSTEFVPRLANALIEDRNLRAQTLRISS
jgi:hypothetical protein